jgi:hypothetical protein
MLLYARPYTINPWSSSSDDEPKQYVHAVAKPQRPRTNQARLFFISSATERSLAKMRTGGRGSRRATELNPCIDPKEFSSIRSASDYDRRGACACRGAIDDLAGVYYSTCRPEMYASLVIDRSIHPSPVAAPPSYSYVWAGLIAAGVIFLSGYRLDVRIIEPNIFHMGMVKTYMIQTWCKNWTKHLAKCGGNVYEDRVVQCKPSLSESW